LTARPGPPDSFALRVSAAEPRQNSARIPLTGSRGCCIWIAARRRARC
jgi:hypothetical protein